MVLNLLNISSNKGMLLVTLSLLIGSGSCFYSGGDGVENLTPANFDSKVTNDDSVWVVEFYAPW